MFKNHLVVTQRLVDHGIKVSVSYGLGPHKRVLGSTIENEPNRTIFFRSFGDRDIVILEFRVTEGAWMDVQVDQGFNPN